MKSRRDLEESYRSFEMPMGYGLMKDASDLLRGSFEHSRKVIGAAIERVYYDNDIEVELVKLKKPPTKKAEKLLRVTEGDIDKMPLDELVVYSAKCKKVKAKLEHILSIELKTEHVEWDIAAESFPPCGTIVDAGNHKELQFTEDFKIYASPLFTLVEDDFKGKLCDHPFFCKKIECAQQNRDKKHMDDYFHVCKYGIGCAFLQKKDPVHMKQFVHLNKPVCVNDKSCTDYTAEHRAEYAHSDNWDFLLKCRDSKCTIQTPSHLTRYTHGNVCFPSIKI